MLAKFGNRGETSLLQRVGRRWPVIVLALVVALVVAAATAPWDVGSRPKYERVTKRVFYEVPTAAAKKATRVPAADKAALLAASGEVPARAAARLGIPQSELVERTSSRARGDVSAVEVSVVAEKDGSGPSAFDMVTVLSDELFAYLRDLDRSALATQRDQLSQEVELARRQLEEIDAASGSSPPSTAAAGSRPSTTTGPPTTSTGPPTTAAPAQGSTGSGLPPTTTAGSDSSRAKAQRNLDALTARLATLSISTPAGLTWFAVSEPATVAISRGAYQSQITAGQIGQNVIRSADASKGGAPADPDATELTLPVRLLFGGAIGLLAGLVAALIMAVWDTRRIDDQRTAEEIFDVGVVADLGSRRRRRRPPLMTFGGRSKWDEAQRALAGNMLHALAVAPADTGAVDLTGSGPDVWPPAAPGGPDRSPARKGRVLMVASAMASEGKTTLTANLAVAAAEAGHRVLAVGCDFRRPRLHEPLPRADGEPLDAVPSPTRVPRLDVAFVVDDHVRAPFAIVADQRNLIAAARNDYDVIILDTAPLLVTDDATPLIAIVDGIVLVVRAGSTLIEAGERLSDLLHLISAPVLGVVLLRFHRLARLKFGLHGGGLGRRPPTPPADVAAAPAVEDEPPVAEPGGTASGPPGDDGVLIRS